MSYAKRVVQSALSHIHHVAGMLAAITIMALMALPHAPACGVPTASAATAITEYCYKTPITVTKSTAGNLTDYPVAITVNMRGLVEQQRLGAYGWDFKPVDPANVDMPGWIQDIESGDGESTMFMVGNVLGGGSSVNWSVYSGNGAVKSNHAMYFHATGTDVVTVTDHADFDITDGLDIFVEASTDDSNQTADLLDKFSANTGYRAHVTTTGGGSLAFTVGNGASSSTLESAWDGSQQLVRFRFDSTAGNDMSISYCSDPTSCSVQANQNSGFASIAANATDITIGEGFTGQIYEAEIRDGVGTTAYSKVEQWGFNPVDLNQTDAGDAGDGWTWEGTVDGLITGHNGTYLITQDQSNITASVGATGLNTGETVSEVSDTTADLAGSLGTVSFSATPAAPPYASWGNLGTALDTAFGQGVLANSSFRFLFVMTVGGLIGGFLYWKLRGENTQIGEHAFAWVMIIVFSGAAVVGIIQPWWAVISGIIVFTAWLGIVAR